MLVRVAILLSLQRFHNGTDSCSSTAVRSGFRRKPCEAECTITLRCGRCMRPCLTRRWQGAYGTVIEAKPPSDPPAVGPDRRFWERPLWNLCGIFICSTWGASFQAFSSEHLLRVEPLNIEQTGTATHVFLCYWSAQGLNAHSSRCAPTHTGTTVAVVRLSIPGTFKLRWLKFEANIDSIKTQKRGHLVWGWLVRTT